MYQPFFILYTVPTLMKSVHLLGLLFLSVALLALPAGAITIKPPMSYGFADGLAIAIGADYITGYKTTPDTLLAKYIVNTSAGSNTVYIINSANLAFQLPSSFTVVNGNPDILALGINMVFNNGLQLNAYFEIEFFKNGTVIGEFLVATDTQLLFASYGQYMYPNVKYTANITYDQSTKQVSVYVGGFKILTLSGGNLVPIATTVFIQQFKNGIPLMNGGSLMFGFKYGNSYWGPTTTSSAGVISAYVTEISNANEQVLFDSGQLQGHMWSYKLFFSSGTQSTIGL